jgi:hypothetical protein
MEIRWHRAKAPLLGPTRLQDPTRLYGVVTALGTGALRVVWSTYTAGGGTVGAPSFGLSWIFSGRPPRISTIGRRSKTSASITRLLKRMGSLPVIRADPQGRAGSSESPAREHNSAQRARDDLDVRRRPLDGALAASYSGFVGASLIGGSGSSPASSTALMWGRRAALRPWRMRTRWHSAGEKRALSFGHGASMCSNSFWAWSAAAAGFAGVSRVPSAKRKRT